ncbi:hypothetical protein H4219_003463 [Mycoemilia scoparia]|uniref:Uncharacterized protein n=1 Tax=Mycoemilia scoparia TaxID=417184 RepID=A0A9W8A2Q1_9FUNG|nr:hypothetical protein H4219_003463 [Mycoemilia scoparia]
MRVSVHTTCIPTPIGSTSASPTATATSSYLHRSTVKAGVPALQSIQGHQKATKDHTSIHKTVSAESEVETASTATGSPQIHPEQGTTTEMPYSHHQVVTEGYHPFQPQPQSDVLWGLGISNAVPLDSPLSSMMGPQQLENASFAGDNDELQQQPRLDTPKNSKSQKQKHRSQTTPKPRTQSQNLTRERVISCLNSLSSGFSRKPAAAAAAVSVDEIPVYAELCNPASKNQLEYQRQMIAIKEQRDIRRLSGLEDGLKILRYHKYKKPFSEGDITKVSHKCLSTTSLVSKPLVGCGAVKKDNSDGGYPKVGGKGRRSNSLGRYNTRVDTITNGGRPRKSKTISIDNTSSSSSSSSSSNSSGKNSLDKDNNTFSGHSWIKSAINLPLRRIAKKLH